MQPVALIIPNFPTERKTRVSNLSSRGSQKMENPTPEIVNADQHQLMETMLSESIQRFNADRRSGVSNFEFYSSIFSRLIQMTPDPPIEVVWFYAAVSFRIDENMEVWDRVRVLKELFGFMVSCSGGGSGSGGLKKVAVLGPVVYELQRLVRVLSIEGVGSEVKCLIEGVVSYVSMCCYETGKGFDGVLRFSPLLMDVVRVWLGERGDDDEFGSVGVLRGLLPMVSDGVRARICAGKEIGLLAGSVMCELFLLCMSVKCGAPDGRDELRRDLQQLAVQLVSGFRDLNFFGKKSFC